MGMKKTRILLRNFIGRMFAGQEEGFLFVVGNGGHYFLVCGGGDVPMFEPIGRLKISQVDKMVRQMRQIYKERPNLFDVPDFAQKIY